MLITGIQPRNNQTDLGLMVLVSAEGIEPST